MKGNFQVRFQGGKGAERPLTYPVVRKEAFDERILGTSDFVHAIILETEEHKLRQTKLRGLGKGIADIIREECKKAGVNENELVRGSRRRKVSQARAVIALRCKEEICCSGAEIARHLGVNTTSINRAIQRAEEFSSV